MEKMPVKQNHEYTVTCDGECNIYDYDTQALLHTHKEGEAQSHFTAIGMAVEYDNADAKLTLVFNSAPGGSSNGGNVEANLNVGHAAADAVAAVCTLTLGDLATGGTLADSNGQSVELDAPHAYATGHVDIADATEAAALYFTAGEEEIEVDFESKPTRNATLLFTPLESYGGTERPYRFSTTEGTTTHEFEWDAPEGSTVQDLKDAINDADGTYHWDSGPPAVTASIDDDGNIVLTRTYQGKSGNGTKVTPSDNTPFVLLEEVEFTNGQDARSPQDVVDILNENEDCPAVAVLDEDEQGITLTAKQYGVDYELSEDGTLFSNPQDMTGSHGDYTIAELLEAIEDEFTDITAAAGTAEGTITLTANTAGKAANTIIYTATGCFGSGTTRQGSTTRGKDAVEQTEYKIFLNGEPLEVDPAPLPTALTPATAMQNRNVYTVEADIDATALPALPANATAEIWVRMGATALNVQLPPAWVWVNGSAADMTGKTHTTFCIAVRNDGVKTLASIAYSYDTTPAQP